jgi:hypothetical protein
MSFNKDNLQQNPRFFVSFVVAPHAKKKEQNATLTPILSKACIATG